MSGDYSRFTFKPRKRFSGVLMQQGRVQLDADWNEEVGILKRRWEIQATDTFGPAAVPKKTTPDGFKILAVNPFKVGAGRLYVDGILAERFADDPWYSNLKLSPEPPTLASTDEATIYLDVWEREVTYIEDADLLETALGGPDTATRTQVVWQIKVRKREKNDPPPACDSPLPPPSAGQLSTRAVAPPPSTDPCVLPPTGNYRGLENRFYRVEIHDGGPLGTATFKWSQENASIVSQVTKFDGKKISVTRIGRDKVLRFQANDWVEVTDDVLELAGLPGKMAKVVNPDEANLVLELDRDVSAGFDPTKPERHTRVRRWDQKDNVDANGLLTTNTTGAWTVLPDGVEVLITADPGTGDLKTGDAWSFAARAIDGSLETLVKEPPQVILHHYAHLATWDGGVIHDCRHLWPDECCCCCTVEVGDGVTSHGDFDDIEDAYAAAVKQARGRVVRICILPGIHRPRRTVVIQHPNVTISGCGQDSRVEAPGRQSIFEIVSKGPSARLEHLYLTSEDSGKQRPNPVARAAAPPPPAPLVLVNDAEDTTIEANLIESVNREAIRASGIGLLVLGNEIWGLPGANAQIPLGGLINLKSAERARVIGNRIGRGLVLVREGSGDVFNERWRPSSAGHGITFSEPDETDDKRIRLLRDIVIAGNEIRGMRGSGIALNQFPRKAENEELPSQPLFIHGLRIESNTITGCAGLEAWDRPDRAPQGGIVVGGIAHLEVTDNHIEGNGRDETVSLDKAPRTAGLYIGHAKGLIARDNVVTENGISAGEWDSIQASEGGIVAVDLVLDLEPHPNPEPPRALERASGWPCALVHGNVVDAPRGRALVLIGLGPMQITDNRLSAATLVLPRAPKVSPLESTGTVFVQHAAPGVVPTGIWGVQNFVPKDLKWFSVWSDAIPLGASLSFADNQVVLNRLFNASPNYPGAVIRIEAPDADLAFHDNSVEFHGGLAGLEVNTRLLGRTARADGNGVFESLSNRFNFVSLEVFGHLLCTAIGNQVTHCLVTRTEGQLSALGNLMMHCQSADPPFPFNPDVKDRRGDLRERLMELLDGAIPPDPALIEILYVDRTMIQESDKLTRDTWGFMGRVIDGYRQPVKGATVDLIDDNNRRHAQLTTDDHGQAFAVIFMGSRIQFDVVVTGPDGVEILRAPDALTGENGRLHVFEVQQGAFPFSFNSVASGAGAAVSEEPKARKATKPRKAAKPRSRGKKET